MQLVVFLPVDCGLDDPTYMMYSQSTLSLEDIKINFHGRNTCCTTIPMTKIHSFSYFNSELNVYRDEINECLRRLLENGNEVANDDSNFVFGTVLMMLGKLMIENEFNFKLTRCKKNLRDVLLEIFENKWKMICIRQDCLHCDFLDWYKTLCRVVKSIDVKKRF